MPQYELFPEEPAPSKPLSVWELTQQIKQLLETAFPAVMVTGEIGDLARPASGHGYFTLKDDRAQIRAVAWRGTLARTKFDLHDGLEVVVHGHLDLYAPRGSYQLIVDRIEPKGLGALELAFRQLRDKLAKAGLFDAERKRPLRRFARRIAFVTSPTGAAIHDFLQVLSRRWPLADVLVVPVRVQGEGAAREIADAIALVNRLPMPIDTLVVGRGGGSVEDLWAFNEEVVVRAIHASRIPVVSAVGHEIDVTLSDFVADVRALTPSEAAELVAPSIEEVAGLLSHYRHRLTSTLARRAANLRLRLDNVAQNRVFRRPHVLIEDRARQLDELDAAARRAVVRKVETAHQRLATVAARLHSLSPLAVLGRGYSLTQKLDGQPVSNSADLTPGETIRTRFAHGQAVSRIESVERESS